MMNSTNKLSVIIPLYNAGDDFRTCMESLITQTWTALEIIIINDGSTDNSVEIAKHYAENYPHVRLLHQANAGASVARNRVIVGSRWRRANMSLLSMLTMRSIPPCTKR